MNLVAGTGGGVGDGVTVRVGWGVGLGIGVGVGVAQIKSTCGLTPLFSALLLPLSICPQARIP